MKFAALVNLTQQGIQGIQQTTQRAAEFKNHAQALGVEITELLWLSGRFDGLMIFNAPDNESAAAMMLQLSRQGNVTTETLRAFDSAEMEQILQKNS